VKGPSGELREKIAAELDEVKEEEGLDAILERIEGELDAALSGDPQEDSAEFAAIDGWAALASYVVARFYAPASPWRRGLAGWSEKAVERLRRIAHALLTALERVAKRLGACSWSVGVSFPWGVSIGLTWS
jgi:glutathione S-transferase